MYRYARFPLLALVILLILSGSSFAIQRTAARLSVVEGGVGYFTPVGSNDGTVIQDFVFDGIRFEPDADRIYDDGVSLWIKYGKVINRHWQATAGFRYAQADFKDTVLASSGGLDVGFFIDVETPTFVQYDLEVNLDYMLTDITEVFISPYAGIGLSGGVIGATFKNFEDEYDATFAARVNFGADLRIWTAADKRGIVTLASVNSWDFAASGDRPKLLQIGGALKYYFRM